MVHPLEGVCITTADGADIYGTVGSPGLFLAWFELLSTLGISHFLQDYLKSITLNSVTEAVAIRQLCLPDII